MNIIPGAAIPTLSVGGRVFTDLANLIQLIAADSGTGNCNTFRLPNASAGYAVPGGKTLRILAAQISIASSTAGNLGCKLLYGDTDVGWSVASTAPTNPVYEGGASAVNARSINNAPTLSVMTEHGGLNFTVPTGKYPAALCFTEPMKVSIYGYLE